MTTSPHHRTTRRSPFAMLGWIAGFLACVLMGLLPFANARADTCVAPSPDAPLSLVFADEFDGPTLDRGTWNTAFLWGPGVVINNERQYYVDDGQFGYDPFRIDDGVLSITAIKTPFAADELYLTRSIYGASAVELLWRVPPGAVRYEVYRDGALIGESRGGSFLDRDLREGIDYAYVVVSFDAGGNRLVTAGLTVNTDERPMPAERRPFSLNVDTRLYGSRAGELVWDSPNRAVRYEVLRDGAPYRTLDGATFTSLYEAGLEPGRRYAYRVEAYDRCDELIIAGAAELDTGAVPGGAPTTVDRLVIGLTVYSPTSGEISWNAVRGARSYRVERDGITVRTDDARSLFVDDLVAGEDRRYRVTALDADGTALDSTTRAINTADNSFARNRQAFLSGVITSYDAFKFRYGRAEARARMPSGDGLWGAFWMLNAYYHQDEPEDPEIDVIEALGGQPNTAYQAYHRGADDDGDGFADRFASEQLSTPIDDFSDGFHVYTVDWSPGRIVWSIDGVETNRYEGDDVSSEQMYLIANLAVGGDFPGPVTESTRFPATMEIDWIRVYQRGASGV